MIVLDTNVISELMRNRPHPAVRAWVDAQPRTTLFTTSATQTEILLGIALLPKGRRREALAAAAQAMFGAGFAERILPYGGSAAAHYADIVVQRRRGGTPIGIFDALIAATARAAGKAVATRDVSGFAGCGLSLLNPWHEAA